MHDRTNTVVARLTDHLHRNLPPWARRLVISIVPFETRVRLSGWTGGALGSLSVEAFRSVMAGITGKSEFVPGRVVLACGSLQPGGAECQVVATLLGLARCEIESVRLLCDRLIPGHSERYDHFLPVLTAAGIEARCAAAPSFWSRFRRNPGLAAWRPNHDTLGPR